MSNLTKVFVLLVSALSIFLCGVVVTYVASSEDWRKKYQVQEDLAKEAQAAALAADAAKSRELDRYKVMVEAMQDNILALERQNSQLIQQKMVESEEKMMAMGSSNTAIETVKSLRETINSMYQGQQFLENKLQTAHSEMLTAQSQVTDLTQSLNSEQFKSKQLELLSRQRLEKISQLEDENTNMRQKLQKITLAPSEFVPEKQVTQFEPSEAGVPIRGTITDLDNDLAAISVGASSGVRTNMRFLVVRGQHYLGDLLITHVEPSEAAGQLVHRQGAVVKGDQVTTSLN